MKKTLFASIIVLFLIGTLAQNSSCAAATVSKRVNLTTSQIQSISSTLDNFNLKIHTKSLFSPEENEELFIIKLKLDTQMQKRPDSSLAPLYYKAAEIFKAREYPTEATDCYQTLAKNFGSTVYGQKAKKELGQKAN